MNKEENKFYEILEKTTQGAFNNIQRQMDLIILNDLKRMSELGVLEIHQTQSDFKPTINKEEVSIKAEIGCRLYFKGEETIKELKEEIEYLKEGLSIRDMFDESSSRYSMPSQQGKRTAFMDGAKWYRENLKNLEK